MSAPTPGSRPPPWVDRDLPRALLRLTRAGHSAARAGPSYRLRGRPPLPFIH
jgi:hypothetical protein